MNPSNGIGSAPSGMRFAAQYNAAQDAKIDREGGMFGAGIIRGVSAITRGEALGHGFWIDKVALSQVRQLGNEKPKGLKMRFTHPSLSSDGMGKLVARPNNFSASVDGEKILMDAHITKSSKSAPAGNFGDHVMDVAEETPDLFATSIVFDFDREAEQAFSAENLDDDGKFKSPDAGNVENFPHVRLSALRAVDFVDDPAANPDGLFSALDDGGQLPKVLEAGILFCLGVSDEKPTEPILGVHPDRIKPFVQGVLERNSVGFYRDTELKQSKESEAESGADSNQTEREDSEMENLKSLTAEQLQAERPDLVEQLQTTVRDECDLAAKAQVKEGADAALNAERERCLGIVDHAESIGATKGVSEALKAGDSVEKAEVTFLRAELTSLKTGTDAGGNLKPTANAEPGKPEAPPKKAELSDEQKIVARAKELQAGGMSAKDALLAASSEASKIEEVK